MSSELHYKLFGVSDKPTLIFLHGFMGSIEDWNEQIELLKNDFNIIAIDLPGHGETNVADEFYQFEKCADAINSTVIRLKLDNPTIVGYSMGGRLALYLAVKYKDKFSNLILESTSYGLATEQEREGRIKNDSKKATELETGSMVWFLDNWYRQPLFDSIKTDRERFELLMQRRLRNSGAKLARSLRGAGLGHQPSLWDKLDEITTATHLIVGGNDHKFKKLAKAMKDKNSKFDIIEISKAGHNVHFECPEKYAEIIKKIVNN